jgi:hypothetical protein
MRDTRRFQHPQAVDARDRDGTAGRGHRSALADFMARLVCDADGKVFLNLNWLRVHRARLVQDWLAGRHSQIEVFYRPVYSPELNPDEGLNGSLKQAVPA